MKKRILIGGSMLFSTLVKAQHGVFVDVVESWKDEVSALYTPAILIALVVFGLFNYKYFFGKDKDYKTGIVNIAWFVGVNALIMAIYSFLASSTLS